MTTTTVNRILLNSDREDAKIVRKWADQAAAAGGSFSVKNAYEDGAWYSTIVINWPDLPAKTEQMTFEQWLTSDRGKAASLWNTTDAMRAAWQAARIK